MMKRVCRAGRVNRASAGKQDGFTLLELIVSMTILSLVTVLIGSGFRLALDSWDKGENETQWTQRLRVLSMLMSQQIKSAYPYIFDTDDEEKKLLFQGENDSVFFVTTLAGAEKGGFKWVRYSYRDETLYYNEGVLPDKKLEDGSDSGEEIIDESLDEFALEYFSHEDNEWSESWESDEELPGAVRIKISNFHPFSINIPVSGEHDENEDD